MEKLAHKNVDFAKDLEIGSEICFIVTVNGLEIDSELWNLYPLQPNDEVVVSYDVGWTAVSMAGVWLWETLGTSFLVSLAINIAVYAINYFTRPNAPHATAGDFTSASPTYSWSGITTTYDVDRPIPSIYGRHFRGGNLIFEGGR
jgi:hypothetical protein